MVESSFTLSYGCPECRPVQTETGKFEPRPITIKMNSSRPTHFKCPYCGEKGKYQLRRWKGTEHLTWVIGYHDGSALCHEVHDCSQCGGKLTIYLKLLKYDVVGKCRACSRQLRGDKLEFGGYGWKG